MQQSKPPSLAKQRIMSAALEHFVLHGYECASLSAIAAQVGIRKASIYAHFASKEALFLQLLDAVVASELQALAQCFAATESFAGQRYCDELEQRYLNNINSRFLIRMAYVPPIELHQMVSTAFNGYLKQLESEIQNSLQRQGYQGEQLGLCVDAFMGIVDSLNVELLYDGSHYPRRLNAMMMLYKLALAQDGAK